MRPLLLMSLLALVGCIVDFPDEQSEGFPCLSNEDCITGFQCIAYEAEEGFESYCEAVEVDDEGNPDAPESSAPMVEIPAGTFMMGCNEAVDSECADSEKPYHEVSVDLFAIDVYEVRAGEYEDCVDAGACTYSGSSSDANRTYNNERDNHPINFVSWFEAQAYCNWVGKRLPTEAEWEKAARGTDGRLYPWGNAPELNCTHVVNYNGDPGCVSAQTMTVGSKPLGVSPYGVMDMVGNVSEWTADWYGVSYYSETPADGWVDPEGPLSGSYRVLRGGSFDDDADVLRTSSRSNNFPDDGGATIGFRCAD